MSWILKTKNKRAFCMATTLMIMLMMIAATPEIASAVENPLKFTVKQVFTTSSTSIEEAEATFTYRLKPLEPEAPMPAGSSTQGYTFSLTGTGSVEIGPLAYNRQGVYRYELLPVVEAEISGYTYSNQVYTIETHVDAALDVRLIVLNNDDEKTSDIVFEQSYNVLPSDPELMPDPPVIKTVFGNPGRASAFTFKLTASDPYWPMPAESENGVKTISITGSGQGKFGTWSYDTAGTYYYTAYEENTKASGYTYDTAVYIITDVVSEDDGQLVVSRVVTNSSNKAVTSLAFNNTYRSGGGGTGTIPGGGNPGGTTPGGSTPGGDGAGTIPGGNPGDHILDDGIPFLGISVDDDPSTDISDGGAPGSPSGIYGPKTGDDMNTLLYTVLFALGGILAIGAMMFLIVAGKRKKVRRLTVVE